MSHHHVSSSATTRVMQTEHTIQLHQAPAAPPSPPVPSADPCLSVAEDEGKSPHANDLFKLAPAEALKMLSASVELLVRLTGDIPPTPPPTVPTDPQMSGMQAEKEQIARSHSEKSLARMRQQAEKDMERQKKAEQAQNRFTSSSLSSTNFSEKPQTIDGVYLRRSAAQSPPSPPTEPKPYIIIGADSQPLNLQHGAITRKFYSRNEPPISIHQYLVRMHKFCPMSTAVYLATSLYIHRLAVLERTIPVTRRNAHRLVLAGLRVAMKALEDLSYPHAKVAKVGGVSEVELARLEISFCFLAGFELVVGEEELTRHLSILNDGKAQQMLGAVEPPSLKLQPKQRKVDPAN
ncbi:hypothetical protein S40293_04464 [Stachybotrys chartarum IBT 40293]|nr:hypothetical protein S40293_04464 [Stachybotrys chartarum IBT 40293]